MKVFARIAATIVFLGMGSLAAAQAPAPGADALLLYQRGRDLEAAGKLGEADKSYTEAIAICDAELQTSPTRMDSFVVKSWCFLRLKRYQDVISTGQAALKVSTDWRIIEVLGEAYYYVDDMLASLRYMQRYVDSVPEGADRVSTAYFFMGEAYSRLKQWEHADISYSIAVYKNPGLYKWWYRLGLVKETLGDKAQAAAAYEKSLGLNPSYAEAAAARDRVRAPAP